MSTFESRLAWSKRADNWRARLWGSIAFLGMTASSGLLFALAPWPKIAGGVSATIGAGSIAWLLRCSRSRMGEWGGGARALAYLPLLGIASLIGVYGVAGPAGLISLPQLRARTTAAPVYIQQDYHPPAPAVPQYTPPRQYTPSPASPAQPSVAPQEPPQPVRPVEVPFVAAPPSPLPTISAPPVRRQGTAQPSAAPKEVATPAQSYIGFGSIIAGTQCYPRLPVNGHPLLFARDTGVKVLAAGSDDGDPMLLVRSDDDIDGQTVWVQQSSVLSLRGVDGGRFNQTASKIGKSAHNKPAPTLGYAAAPAFTPTFARPDNPVPSDRFDRDTNVEIITLDPIHPNMVQVRPEGAQDGAAVWVRRSEITVLRGMNGAEFGGGKNGLY